MEANASDVEAINATLENFLGALRANDLNGIVGFYTPDALLMPPNHQAVRGTEAIRSWFKNVLESFTIEAFTSSPQELVVAGDWAFRLGTFDWTLKAKVSGEQLEPCSKFLQIWERQGDGSWRVARGIWNSNDPA